MYLAPPFHTLRRTILGLGKLLSLVCKHAFSPPKKYDFEFFLVDWDGWPKVVSTGGEVSTYTDGYPLAHTSIDYLRA